ncbi:MAG: hypothetical protein HUU57_16020 [Bdellovibrio sp.]|nr:hypothetical protein [Bdellovibrio sp.]
MKAFAFVLIAAFALSSANASANTLSCSQMVQLQDKYAAELAYLREKIRTSRNSDSIELYMDQYEDIYARYINATENLNDRCK